MRQPLSGGKAEPIVNLGEYGIKAGKWLSWSPDGKRLAMNCSTHVSKDPLATGQLLIARIEGNQLRETATVDVHGWTGLYSWSPDSTHVAYMCQDSVPVRSAGRLYEVAVDNIVERIEAGAIPGVTAP